VRKIRILFKNNACAQGEKPGVYAEKGKQKHNAREGFSLWWELNPRPLAYKASALPLSYRGILSHLDY
jgi:hypothetical protein